MCANLEKKVESLDSFCEPRLGEFHLFSVFAENHSGYMVKAQELKEPLSAFLTVAFSFAPKTSRMK